MKFSLENDGDYFTQKSSTYTFPLFKIASVLAEKTVMSSVLLIFANELKIFMYQQIFVEFSKSNFCQRIKILFKCGIFVQILSLTIIRHFTECVFGHCC